jgi:voltage-gated sodium channel
MKTNSVVVSTCRGNPELTPLLNPVIFKHAFAQVPGYEGTFITFENLQLALDIIHKRSPSPPKSAPAELGAEVVAVEEEEEAMAYSVSNGGTFAFGIKATSVDEEVYDVANFYWETGISQEIARHDTFIYVTLAVISLNAVYLGINADHNKADLLLDADIGFFICENLFCVFFTFELAIRFLAFEQKMDCLKDGWFKFDSFLVFLMVAETWFVPYIPTGSSAPPPTGPIRLLRLLRLSRLVRLLRSLPDLVVIVKGMYSAFRAVGSSLLMICMLIYLFAIIMHMLLAEDEATASHFETLPRCMWTLLMDGTFLNDVGGVMGKLIHRGEPNCVIASILFMIFVLLAALTVMNMLIGILCEVVSGVAASEKEEAAGRVMRETILMELKKFDDGDGLIDEDEVNELMADPRSIEVLDALGIDISFLQGLQVMTYEEPGVSFPMKTIIEQMLSCRGDLPCTVAHMIMQQKVNDWKLCNSIIQHEERIERKLDACFTTLAAARKSSKQATRIGWA